MGNDINLQFKLDLKTLSVGLQAALKLGKTYQKQFSEILSGTRVDIDEKAFQKELDNLEKKYKEFDRKVEGEKTEIKADASKAKAEAKGAENAVKKVPKKSHTEFSSNGKQFATSIATVGVALTTVTMGIRRVSGALGGLITLSNTQEDADSGLINTLKVKDQYSKQYFNTLKETAGAIQKVTKVGDEQSEMLMALAINMGLQKDKVVEATKGSIGLATAFEKSGLSQETAMKGIALAYQGNFEQLQRYIPALRSAKTDVEKMTILQKSMKDGFKLSTEAAKTGSGQLFQYKNIVNDIREDLGTMIKTAIVPLASMMTTVFEYLHENQPVLQGVIGTLGAITVGLIAAKLATIQWNMALLMNPITGIIAGVTILGAGLTMLANKLGGWGNLWQAAKDYAVASLTIAWDYIKAFGQGIVNFGKLALDALLFPWRAMWESVKGIFSKLGEAWKLLLTGDIKGALSVMGGEIVGGFSAAFEEVKQSAGTLWNTFDGLGTKAAETWRSVQVGATETKEAVIAATDEVTEKQENFVAQLGSSLKIVGRNIDTNLTQKLDKVQVKWKQTQVKLTESEKNFVNIFRGIGNQMSSILSGAFTEMADKGVLSFKRILQGFKNMVIQMVAEIAGRALLLAFLTSIGGGSLTTWTGLLSGGKASSVGSYLLGSFVSGGVVPGGEKVIRVNEEGEEFVMNHRATRILGTNFLNSIMAFPEHFKALFGGLKMPSLPTMPQPAYAFASGGSTQSAAFPDMDRYMDRLDEKLDTLIEKFEYIRNLRLVAKMDNEKIAVAAENGRTSLESREL